MGSTEETDLRMLQRNKLMTDTAHSESDGESADEDGAPVDDQAVKPDASTNRTGTPCPRAISHHLSPAASTAVTNALTEALKASPNLIRPSLGEAASAALAKYRNLMMPKLPAFEVGTVTGLAAAAPTRPKLFEAAAHFRAESAKGAADLRAKAAADFRAGMGRVLDAQVPHVDLTAYTSVMANAFSAQATMQKYFTDVGITYATTMSQVRKDVLKSLAPAVSAAEMLRGYAAVGSTLTSTISELMRGWNVLSGLGHRLSNWALNMALKVRNELLTNPDRNAVRRAVEWFMRHVLRYTWINSDDHVEAASTALLDDSWLPAGDQIGITDVDVCKELRRLTDINHNLWRPISETTLKGRAVACLDDPLATYRSDDDGEGALTEGDRLRALDEFMPQQSPVTSSVLKRLFETLTPIEQEIVWAKYHDGRTWADAAVACGCRIEDGERTRRKFLRLRSTELRTRSA